MRTFVAIDLSPAVKEQMRILQRQIQVALRPIGGDHLFKWTLPEKVHVTLRFLGETSDTQTQHLAKDLHRIGAETAPFSLQLGGMGVFPNWRRLRVLWVGIEGESAALHRLQQAVEAAAQAAGFAAEDKPFAPHITLARMGKSARNDEIRSIGEFLAQAAQTITAPRTVWHVDEMVHMQSKLHSEGAIYTPIQHFALVANGETQV